jgi:hypothetical protein
MAVEDLPVETSLSHTIITQTIKVPFRGSLDIIREFLSRVYMVEEDSAQGEIQLVVMDDVRISLGRDNEIVTYGYMADFFSQFHLFHFSHINLEWCSNPVTDMIADSVVCILLSIETNVANAKSTHCREANNQSE